MQNNITLVREVLIPLAQYPHLMENEPIGNAVALLLQHGSADGRHLYYDELLVTNSTGQLSGHILIQDILTSFFPSILATPKVQVYGGKKDLFTDLSILLEDSFRRECRRQAEMTVNQFMIEPHRSIADTTHLLHALEIMIKDNETTLPVTEDDILVGAVRIQDIFRVLGTYCTI
ncbi:MAG: HPP family protein [Desulfopila sp.]